MRSRNGQCLEGLGNLTKEEARKGIEAKAGCRQASLGGCTEGSLEGCNQLLDWPQDCNQSHSLAFPGFLSTMSLSGWLPQDRANK